LSLSVPYLGPYHYVPAPKIDRPPPQIRLPKADEFGSDQQEEENLKGIENYEDLLSPTLTRFDLWNCQTRSDAWRYKTLAVHVLAPAEDCCERPRFGYYSQICRGSAMNG
jgi:hypothetical protein